mmetsp:Transcript_51273/g.104272  ORF Transcript_51273/g.104272 Transcript_51273/m.104272 type:complete len:84 (+) Transcript_51273:92-343(+)
MNSSHVLQQVNAQSPSPSDIAPCQLNKARSGRRTLRSDLSQSKLCASSDRKGEEKGTLFETFLTAMHLELFPDFSTGDWIVLN